MWVLVRKTFVMSVEKTSPEWIRMILIWEIVLTPPQLVVVEIPSLVTGVSVVQTSGSQCCACGEEKDGS